MRSIADTWWLVPNLIDYLRLIFVIIGFVLGNFYQLHTANACLYVLSHVLDMVDGMAARYLDQCSTFGVILDYSIDIITEMIWFIQLTPLIHNFSTFPKVSSPLRVVKSNKVIAFNNQAT